KDKIFIFSIIIVQIIGFFVFYVYCNFKSFVMAFQLKDFHSAEQTTYWTFQNFVNMWNEFFVQDNGALMEAFKNTMIFFVLSNVFILWGFCTSYFIYKKVWGYKMFRILLFIPAVLSSVVWSNIFINVVGIEGPVAKLVQVFGGLEEVPELLTNSDYALKTVIGYSVWFAIGTDFVLLTGSFARIPQSLIEVGKLEGIKWGNELIRVVTPLVWPTLSTLLILNLTTLFLSSGNILLLTNGEYGTMTLSHFLFTRVYGIPETSNSFNYASAIGLVLTVLTLPLVFLARYLANKVEEVTY
ncbi:MAG: sugar ABC transporter permease, partial [Clostridia bacterium]|nr:sugar ABC transporter permease [Clostridia bacterium]